MESEETTNILLNAKRFNLAGWYLTKDGCEHLVQQ